MINHTSGIIGSMLQVTAGSSLGQADPRATDGQAPVAVEDAAGTAGVAGNSDTEIQAAGTAALSEAAAPGKTRTARVKRTRIVCISHKEDLDGISAAALVKQAFGGDTILTDYLNQMQIIEDVSSDSTLKKLFICDLGLSKKNQEQFIEIMQRLRRARVSIVYVDHHAIDPDVARRLSDLKVRMIHDPGECSTVLAYEAFKSKLQFHATFVATCAAITDYMEDKPGGARLLQMYDRQFALISATVMTYNITGHQKDDEYLVHLVDELASSRYPHEIQDSFVFAQTQVERLSELIDKVKAGLKKMRNLAHMEVTDAGAGGAVNFVLGMSGKEVGVAYKEKTTEQVYTISIRGARSCSVHLGKIVNVLATELGGSGGGHDKACGAVIPITKIKKFLSELNKRIADGQADTTQPDT